MSSMGLFDVSQVHIDLDGYASGEARHAVANQVVQASGVTITLSDNTVVTFQNVGKLTSSNFS